VPSGPFRLARAEPPLRIETARFEEWWGDARSIGVARASYLAVTQGETRAALAEAGEAEIALALPAAAVERVRRNPRVELRVVTIPRTRLVKLNAGHAFFDDARERRAFSLALDRAGMARAILRNPAAAAGQLFPPALGGWHQPDLAPLERDPAEARRLLAACGWTPGPDGILRDASGQRFAPLLRTFSSWPELPVIATAMQAQLREIGVAMEVAVGNSSEIPAGHRDGTLQIGLMSRNFSITPDPLGTLLEDFGPRGGDWGAMGWHDPALTAAIEELGGAFDPAQRAPLRRRIAEILHRELPTIPISYFDLPVAISRRVTGVEIDPFEINYRLHKTRWAA
jgi:peptide/nickel transport system substrate-binding protein